jgi:AcrR family transcriptional regulator
MKFHMGRNRTIPDETIFLAIRTLLAEGGEKAVAFSSVSRATGLAAPTLVQRYGSRDAMLRAALMQAWDGLEAATGAAEAEAPLSAKGAAQLLKALSGEEAQTADLALLAADFRDSALRARAAAWRDRVEGALALRLGGGAKGREAAAILFAAWQGQALWHLAGERSFRIKDAIRRLV